jgi:TonB family protein
MTLRKSILLSLALHLFAVGTAVSFARFAGDLLLGRHDPIMVALIGREGASSSGKEEKAAVPRPAERKEQAPQKADLHEQTPLQPETAPSPVAAAQEQAIKQQLGQETTTSQEGQQTSGSNGQSPSAASAPAGSNSGSVSSERWAVIVSSIERVKSYPRLARERGIEGVVRLRFKIKPQGEVDRVEIIKSSGSDVLDTASVHTLYRAGPMPYVNGWVEVPIAYVLR